LSLVQIAGSTFCWFSYGAVKNNNEMNASGQSSALAATQVYSRPIVAFNCSQISSGYVILSSLLMRFTYTFHAHVIHLKHLQQTVVILVC